MNVTALAGGVGGAKLLVGLERALPNPATLTAIVNTGDDSTFYGVHVSPDVDIVTYWLAGLADTERGWGVRGDTFRIVDGLAELGAESWFRLGDRDFATCIYRTERLKQGAGLAEVAAEIADSLGVTTRIIPMTNDRVATMLETADGRTLEFQEYFVKERALPEVRRVRFEGIETAAPAPGVLEAIEGADRVVICPSNPLVSVGPILSLPGVREALVSHPNVVAVSPIVEGAALKGPADKMMAAGGIPVGPDGVAGLYRDFLDGFVLDSRDASEAVKVEGLGIRSLVCDTIMIDHDHSEELARSVLGWLAA